jgi:hypothetical protein
MIWVVSFSEENKYIYHQTLPNQPLSSQACSKQPNDNANYLLQHEMLAADNLVLLISFVLNLQIRMVSNWQYNNTLGILQDKFL